MEGGSAETPQRGTADSVVLVLTGSQPTATAAPLAAAATMFSTAALSFFPFFFFFFTPDGEGSARDGVELRREGTVVAP
jgi:hypothetical protein